MSFAADLSLWGILPFGGIGTGEMLVLGIVAVLLFGSRLPEMGRTIGKGLLEFKKGLSGLEDELRSATQTSPPPRRQAPAQRTFNPLDDREESTAPKFEPPRAEPREESPSA